MAYALIMSNDFKEINTGMKKQQFITFQNAKKVYKVLLASDYMNDEEERDFWWVIWHQLRFVAYEVLISVGEDFLIEHREKSFLRSSLW